MRYHRLASMLLALNSALALAAPALSADDPAYRAEVERFRVERADRLRAEDGWLAVSGLHWLKAGPNRIGSDRGNEVVLRAGAPALLGTLTLETEGSAGLASFRAGSGVAMTRDETPFAEGPIRSDADGGRADVLRSGDFRLTLLRRNERFALRVKDARAPTRAEFRGLRWFPIDEGWQVVARFTPHATPRTIRFETIIGGADELPSPGTVEFERDGRTCTLEAATEGDGKLWFVFRDATSGDTTAGNARQLTADAPVGDTVLLDFNRAENLPCAYIDHATCPIAPPQNRLPIAVRAGEQVYRPEPKAAK